MIFFRFREKELWILIVAGLLLFYRPLFFGETFFFRDLYLHFFPQKMRFVDLLRSGELPLWDPYLHGGQPFLADLNNMALYPFNLVYLVLPSVFAFNLDMIFHVLLSAAGAYWLARALGVSKISSLVAGAVYGFSGYTLSLTNLLSRLSAMPYLPLMLLTIHAFFKDRRPRWFVLCVIFGAIQIFAGAPEMTLLTFLFLLGWVLFAGIRDRLASRLAIYAAVSLLVAGIAAIQIVPTTEMVRQSVRSANSDYNSFSAWSLHPKRIPEMFFPGLLGRTDRVSKADYWGRSFESMGFPFILSIYFGWVAISLAILGIMSKEVPRKLRIFLAAAVLVTIFVSIGRYLPGFKAFYQSIPFASAVRYPIKFLAGGILPFAMLSAFGLDEILRPDARKKRIAIYFWLSASLFISWALILKFSNETATTFMNSYFGQSTDRAVTAARNSFLYTALISLAAACIYQYRIVSPKTLQHFLFAALILFDLIRNGAGVNHFAPAEFFTDPPGLVQTVKKEIRSGRFYRAHNPPGLVLKLPANEAVHFSRWNLETLHNYAGPLYSIPVIFHEDFDNLAQKELVHLSDHVIRISWERRLPILTAGAVSLFMATDRLNFPGIELIATVRTSSNLPFFLYRNQHVKGIAWNVTQVKWVSTPEESFRQMNLPGFDPANELLISAEMNQDAVADQACRKAEIVMTENQATRLAFHSRFDCDSYIYFAQPFYDGWITLVDGKEIPSVPANYAFSASLVKKGEHHIERVYRPKSVAVGGFLSFISMWLLVATFLLLRRIF